MFDLGWSELLVIGVVALIVVGPKDLPLLFRNVGRFVGKARGMAREFSRAMEDAAQDSGVNDIKKSFKTATNPMGAAFDGLKDATRDLTKGLDPTKYDPASETGKLAAERADSAKKIQAATARAAADRKAREAAEALAKAEEAEAALSAPAATAKAVETPAPDSETKA